MRYKIELVKNNSLRIKVINIIGFRDELDVRIINQNLKLMMINMLEVQ